MPAAVAKKSVGAAKKSAAKLATRQAVRKARIPVAGDAASPRLTHGERVIDTASGATKADLFAYYQAVAGLLLPHLEDRPVSLVRAPSGLGGQTFFQKHVGVASLAGVSQLDPRLDPDNPPMLKIDSSQGIASAAQWNVVEFHTQNATATDYLRPDRIIFDLDPGERVSWASVREGAQLLNALLGELGLKGFLKTSGGKGLHIVVPFAAQARLGCGEGPGGRGDRPHGQDDSGALRRQVRRRQSRRQDLYRLSAQRPRLHDRGGLVVSRPSGTGHLRATALGRTCRREVCRPVDDGQRSRALQRWQQAMGGLCQVRGQSGARPREARQARRQEVVPHGATGAVANAACTAASLLLLSSRGEGGSPPSKSGDAPALSNSAANSAALPETAQT